MHMKSQKRPICTAFAVMRTLSCAFAVGKTAKVRRYLVPADRSNSQYAIQEADDGDISKHIHI